MRRVCNQKKKSVFRSGSKLGRAVVPSQGLDQLRHDGVDARLVLVEEHLVVELVARIDYDAAGFVVSYVLR